MRQPTLRQAECFHAALGRACGQCGLEMRYLGALAHPDGPGLQPAVEPAVWSVERTRRRAGPLSLKPAPEVLFRLALGAAAAGAFTLSVAGASLTVQPFAATGRGRASWRAALQRHGVDAEKFLAVLKKEAARA